MVADELRCVSGIAVLSPGERDVFTDGNRPLSNTVDPGIDHRAVGSGGCLRSQSRPFLLHRLSTRWWSSPWWRRCLSSSRSRSRLQLRRAWRQCRLSSLGELRRRVGVLGSPDPSWRPWIQLRLGYRRRWNRMRTTAATLTQPNPASLEHVCDARKAYLPAHNPEVAGSNPAPVIMRYFLTWDFSGGRHRSLDDVRSRPTGNPTLSDPPAGVIARAALQPAGRSAAGCIPLVSPSWKPSR